MLNGTASKMSVGQFREFAGVVLRSLPDDLNPQEAQGWVENAEALRKVLRSVLVSKTVNPNVYHLTVNYDQPVADAIAAGKYDWVNSDITQKNFPTKRSGQAEVEIELVHFNRAVSTKEVLVELDKRGLRPAELHELLSLGAKYPELQREFPIIGLASVLQRSYGSRSCPCLGRYGSERRLALDWLEIDWGVYCRFAAVRK